MTIYWFTQINEGQSLIVRHMPTGRKVALQVSRIISPQEVDLLLLVGADSAIKHLNSNKRRFVLFEGLDRGVEVYFDEAILPHRCVKLRLEGSQNFQYLPPGKQHQTKEVGHGHNQSAA